jgi:hypothetical protein
LRFDSAWLDTVVALITRVQRRQEMEGDEDGGEEKDKEAEDPHERAG